MPAQTNVSEFCRKFVKKLYTPKVYSPSQYRKETTERLSYDKKRFLKIVSELLKMKKKVVEKI